MEIELLYVPDCPNRDAARSLVERALSQVQRTATLREHEVRSPEEALRLGMRGSPTILIDGADPFGVGGEPAAVVACRLYRSGDGIAGVPAYEELVEALGR
jgi:hypothetical protein